MATSTIDRKPDDCNFDIEEVLEEIKFHNSSGNNLTGWTVDADTITLIFS